VILGTATWTELGSAAELILVVPLGSTEQHGPHLPISTDTDVAVAVAHRAAAVRPDVVVAPALPYGSSGEHAGFPGTLSIGQGALEHVVVELVRSADAFGSVVLVSGHGGNAEPLARAARTLQAEGRRVTSWIPRGYVDAHAGRTETSLMLALHPELVRAEAAVAGDVRPIADLLPELRAGGVQAVAPNGVLGDPAGASAAEGEAVLGALVDDLLAAIDQVGARV
jgi:mycofactocin system creatininase family protein